MHIEKNVGVVLHKFLDAPKQELYDNANEDIKKIKRSLKVPSASTSIGSWHPLCVPKLHKYHQLSSVQRKAMCVVLGSVKVSGGYSSNFTRCVNLDKIWGRVVSIMYYYSCCFQ